MMPEAPVGESLLGLAATAERELIMCAPFAKEEVVRRVLDSANPSLRPELFTRWRPEEVASGVSDTGVLDAISERGGSVWLNDRLHAKYYRTENRVLLGSANLTARALGWLSVSNIELLVEVRPPVVDELESRLRLESVEATQMIADEINHAASLLGPPVVDIDMDTTAQIVSSWTPQLRQPADLFRAYRSGLGNFSRATSAAAQVDLQYLDLPIGLDEEQFNALIANRLLCSSVIRNIDNMVVVPRRFGEMRSWLEGELAIERDEADFRWQTMMRWLLEFMPDRYERFVNRRTEMFARVRREDGEFKEARTPNTGIS